MKFFQLKSDTTHLELVWMNDTSIDHIQFMQIIFTLNLKRKNDPIELCNHICIET